MTHCFNAAVVNITIIRMVTHTHTHTHTLNVLLTSGGLGENLWPQSSLLIKAIGKLKRWKSCVAISKKPHVGSNVRPTSCFNHLASSWKPADVTTSRSPAARRKTTGTWMYLHFYCCTEPRFDLINLGCWLLINHPRYQTNELEKLIGRIIDDDYNCCVRISRRTNKKHLDVYFQSNLHIYVINMYSMHHIYSIYVYICLYIYPTVYICIYIYISVSIQIYIYIFTYTDIYIYTHTYILYIYMSIYLYIYVYIHIYIYTEIYLYIYIYIYTVYLSIFVYIHTLPFKSLGSLRNDFIFKEKHCFFNKDNIKLIRNTLYTLLMW